jgi:hypothetical protein
VLAEQFLEIGAVQFIAFTFTVVACIVTMIIVKRVPK